MPSDGVEHRDPHAEDFRIGDPCIDLATGRTVVVAGTPDETVAEWSNNEDFDLLDVHGNERCRASPNDPVVEAVYAASVQSEPSGPRRGDGPYTFPSSRLARVTVESVDRVERVYDMVAEDVLRRLFAAVEDHPDDRDGVDYLARKAGLGDTIVDRARELATVDATIGTGGDDA